MDLHAYVNICKYVHICLISATHYLSIILCVIFPLSIILCYNPQCLCRKWKEAARELSSFFMKTESKIHSKWIFHRNGKQNAQWWVVLPNVL